MTMVGVSEFIRNARLVVERYAPSQLPIVLIGPSGSGKEVLAELVHEMSRRPGELIDINCAALPAELVEGLLFGHRRGAFTGASDMPGLVQRADQGTLFLDELGSLSPAAQAKLLRVLETREVRRLGSGTKERVDFRLVAAAQADMRDHVEAGRFREDLWHRMAGVVIQVPPLRDRREDVEPLARHFAGLTGHRLSDAALATLRARDWRGNVRELRLTVERAALVADGWLVDLSAVEESFRAAGLNCSDTSEREMLASVCAAEGWDAERSAVALGVSRATLYRRLKVCGLSLRAAAKAHELIVT